MGSVNLFGFERFGWGAVVEAVGDGLFIGGHFFTTWVGEVIEASRGDKERVVVLREGFFDLGVARFSRELHRDVSAGTGKLREGFDLEEVFLKWDDFSKVELYEVKRRVERNLTSTGGENLRVGADGLAAELDISGEEETIASAGGELDFRATEGGLHGGFDIVEIDLAILATCP